MMPTKSPKTKKSPVKALTIRQPWAELILRGRKPYELRSWKTNYRGFLAIHAAAKINAEKARRLGLNPERLIVGAFVGVAILSDVRPHTREDARLLKKKRAGLGGIRTTFRGSRRNRAAFPRSKPKGNSAYSKFRGSCGSELPGAPAFELDFTWVADPLIFKGPCLGQTSFL
jgi:hypothetical protein